MIDRKSVKALVTGVLNDDDAEVNRIIEACLESVFSSRLEDTTRAVFESVGSRQKPVMG